MGEKLRLKYKGNTTGKKGLIKSIKKLFHTRNDFWVQPNSIVFTALGAKIVLDDEWELIKGEK